MKTRSHTRRRKHHYIARLKSSPCRGKTRHCTLRRGCKKTRSGKRKSYCRRRTNSHF